MLRSFVFLFLFFWSFFVIVGTGEAQDASFRSLDDRGDEDINVGGDIFSDFEEDLEASQVLEDERFYRYGRFYSFMFSAGMTKFTGNRGRFYTDRHPTLGLGLMYFTNFNVAFGIGLTYSQHFFGVYDRVVNYNVEGGAGLIEVNMFRTYFAMRYYFDTSNLGTAITYASPHLILRMEFWNQTNKFTDRPTIPNESNGAIGGSVGGGLEFPLEVRQSYIGFEFLMHSINFKDSYTTAYRPVNDKGEPLSGGIQDLKGGVMTATLNYVVSW